MKKKYRVLNMGHLPFAADAFKVLEDLAEIQIEPPERKRLLELIPGFDAYFCTLKVVVDREILDAADKLIAIATPSTGLDHIDVPYARSRGIAVLSIREEYGLLRNITATAELAWALMLGVLRKTPWGFDAVKRGVWGRDLFRGHQISGKTFGILGYGRLGEMVAEYARAFRMKVIACDIKEIESDWVEQVDFDTLLRESDILSIHIHLTEENRGLIGWEAFSKMKNGIVLINTSRGGIIDEEAFLEALESGKVGAAGLDVISGEWRSDLADHPLIRYAREHDNLLISPHVGGVAFEAQVMATGFAAKKLADYLRSYEAKAAR